MGAKTGKHPTRMTTSSAVKKRKVSRHQKECQKRRRLVEEDDIQDKNEKSPPPSSPDHTYKTEDDNSDQENEWDMELEHMDPCEGSEELQSSADDDDDYDDDDGTDSGDDDVEHVVPAKQAVKLSASAHNLEGLVRVRGMLAKESSMS